MNSELDRLYNRISDFFKLLSEHDKRLSSLETKVNSHLDVSEVRVKAYDEDIKALQVSSDKNTDFRIEHDAKKKGAGATAKWVQWLLTILHLLVTGTIALIAFGGKLVKISNP